MADEERIFQLLAQLAADQAEMRRDINSISTKVTLMEYGLDPMKKGYESLRADVTRIQLDVERIRDFEYSIMNNVGDLCSRVPKLDNTCSISAGQTKVEM